MFTLNSINWYLTKTNNAIDKISQLIPPEVDSAELRFQYSSLIESMFSTIDYLIDDKEITADKDYINNKIKDNIGVDGDVILQYMREVRNAVVHRGLDITARCDVVRGKIAAYAPEGITSQNGRQKKKPSDTYLNSLLFKLDRAIKSVVRNQLTNQGLLTRDSEDKIDIISNRIKTMTLPNNVPESTRTMHTEWQKSLDMNTAKQLASSIHNSLIDELEKKLNIVMDIRYLS